MRRSKNSSSLSTSSLYVSTLSAQMLKGGTNGGTKSSLTLLNDIIYHVLQYGMWQHSRLCPLLVLLCFCVKILDFTNSLLTLSPLNTPPFTISKCVPRRSLHRMERQEQGTLLQREREHPRMFWRNQYWFNLHSISGEMREREGFRYIR